MVNVAVFAPWKEHPELVRGPAAHGWSSNNVFGYRFDEEPLGCHHGDFAGVDPIPGYDPEDSAVVVKVRVGVDNGADWAMSEVFGDQLVRRVRCFGGGQWVDDNPTRLAANKGGVRAVEPSDLLEAVTNLVEPMTGVETSLAPQ